VYCVWLSSYAVCQIFMSFIAVTRHTHNCC